MDARRRILLNTPHIETASGSVANFKTDMIAPLKGCKINFLPKQSGSGDPSPTNVRPISGWDGMEVVRCGKNLFDASAVIRRDGYRLDDNGTEVSTDVSGYTEGLTRVSPNAVYTFRGNISSASYAGRLYFYDRNKNFISRSESIYYDVSHYTFNTPGNCFYIALQYVVSVVDFSTIQIEKGQLTVYEPYTASTFSITWTQQGTVYGGYVDLVSGELWKTYEIVDLGTKNWTEDSQTDAPGLFRCGGSNFLSIKYLGENYCSNYKPVQERAWRSVDYGEISVTNSEGAPIVRVRDERFVGKTESEVKTMLSGVKYAYEKRQAVLVDVLTPTQIKTLKGINNVYSDADSTEVKFWTH